MAAKRRCCAGQQLNDISATALEIAGYEDEDE